MTNTADVNRKGRLRILLRLFKYILRHKFLMFTIIFLTLSSNLLSLVGPYLSGLAINNIELGKGNVNFPKVFYYTSLMIAFFLLSSALSYLLSILMIKLSQNIIYRMRQDVFEHLADMPVSYFDKFQAGDLISRITYDIDTINSSLSNDFIQIMTSFITVLGSLFMMIVISPKMVSIFAVTVPLSVIYIRKMTGIVRPLFRKRSAKLGELNGYVEEIISGQKTIKAYHQEENMIKKFDVKNDEAVAAYYNADYYASVVGPSMNFINNMSLSLVSIFGAILYLFNQITIGNISSFVLYSRKFSGPINEAANILSELQSAAAAAERIFNLLDSEIEKKDPENAHEFENVKGKVDLKNVDFSYNDEKMVLKNFNLNVKKGSLIAIVGPTGAGKTTIINLLMRFYDPQSGKIYLDDIDTKNATLKSLRSSYAMVLQDTWLFKGTIYENIKYGKDDATLEDVIRVCKACDIHDFIMSLPAEYDTIINEEGLNISQGQKQLFTIARAMLMDSPMLILDEATSNIDTITELKIQEAMRKLMKDKTCFVIAHRLSTIKNADRILVINDGKIIEQGTHEELLKKGGFYQKLFYSQFGNIA